MLFKTFLNIFICSLVFIACSDSREGWEKHVRDKDALSAQLSITSSSLESHITALSSDEFQGRFPGTVGEVKTINNTSYIIYNITYKANIYSPVKGTKLDVSVNSITKMGIIAYLKEKELSVVKIERVGIA